LKVDPTSQPDPLFFILPQAEAWGLGSKKMKSYEVAQFELCERNLHSSKYSLTACGSMLSRLSVQALSNKPLGGPRATAFSLEGWLPTFTYKNE
jgi:hypothetical protein